MNMNMKNAIEDKAAEEQQDVQAELKGGEKHWMNRVLDCDVCFPHLDDTLPYASTSASTSKPVSAVVTEGQEQDMTPADKYSTFIDVSHSNGSRNADFSTGDVSRSIASVAPPEPNIVYSKSPVTLTSTMPKEEAKYGDSSTQSTSAWKQLFRKETTTLPKSKVVQQQQQAIEKRQDTNTDGRRVSWRSVVTNKAPKLNADHGRDMLPAHAYVFSIIPCGMKPLRTGYGSPMNTQGYGCGGCYASWGAGPLSPQPQHGQNWHNPQHPSSPYGSNPPSPYGQYSTHHQQQYPNPQPQPHPQQQQQQQNYPPY